MLKRVEVCCRVLQGVAACCSVLQCVAVCCSVLQRGSKVDIGRTNCSTVCYSVLQCVAECCSVLQCVAVCAAKLISTGVSPNEKFAEVISIMIFHCKCENFHHRQHDNFCISLQREFLKSQLTPHILQEITVKLTFENFHRQHDGLRVSPKRLL